MSSFAEHTPWGTPDHACAYDEGVTFYGTASHGGFHLSAEANEKVPAAWRAASFKRLGEAGWYEEDCDWCMVALTFPASFSAAQLGLARRTFDACIAPKLVRG